MRNKKSLLSICLFALVLILGVGYAVVNYVDLTISGTATAKAQAIKVSFSKVKTVNPSDKVKATAQAGTLTGTITVSELTLNETVSATYTIQNQETDVDATVIQQNISNNNSEYFQVTTDATSAKTVSKGGTVDVTVSVKLIKTPVKEANNSATIGVTFRAAPVDNKTS
jgi:hypothetical protein